MITFYQFNQPPTFFDAAAKKNLITSGYSQSVSDLELRQTTIFEEKKVAVFNLLDALNQGDEAEIFDRAIWIPSHTSPDGARSGEHCQWWYITHTACDSGR